MGKIKNADWQRDLLVRIGVLDTLATRKVTHKHAIVNLERKNEIMFTETPHSAAL